MTSVADIPLSTKFAMVRECKILFGEEQARWLWRHLGLPVPSESPDPLDGGVRVAAPPSTVVPPRRSA